jgi:DNA-binding transcriptional MerR regulator
MTMLDPSAIELPQIPGKRYFTIGEVSELCGVKPHVLRYWEQEFPQLRPIKRRGNRRYYQRHEVELIREIRRLLYLDGYTIGGARNQLQKTGNKGEVDPATRQSSKDYSGIIDELRKISLLLEG